MSCPTSSTLLLQGCLPAWVRLPSSAALPFGAFESVLNSKQNASVAQVLQALVGEAAPSEQQLVKARQAMQQLIAPPEMQQQVTEALQQSGESGSTCSKSCHEAGFGNIEHTPRPNMSACHVCILALVWLTPMMAALSVSRPSQHCCCAAGCWPSQGSTCLTVLLSELRHA